MLSNNNNQVKTKNGENDLYDEKLVALFRPEMLGKRKGKDKKNSHTQASERIIEAADDSTAKGFKRSRSGDLVIRHSGWFRVCFLFLLIGHINTLLRESLLLLENLSNLDVNLP